VDFLTIHSEQAEHAVFPAERHRKNGLDAAEISHRAGQCIAVSIQRRGLKVGHVDSACAAKLALLHGVGRTWPREELTQFRRCAPCRHGIDVLAVEQPQCSQRRIA
jgi:hypothetical protein